MGRIVTERRPITDEERPHLAAMGRRLAELRRAACLTQAQLGAVAGVTDDTIGRIERGQRRTRRSTLGRIATGLAVPDPVATADELAAVAGPGLAPESTYIDRLARRRARHEGRYLAEAVKALTEALREARRLQRITRDPESMARTVALIEVQRDAAVARLEDYRSKHLPAVRRSTPSEAPLQFRDPLAGLDTDLARAVARYRRRR